MSPDHSALTELRDHTSRKRFLRLGGTGLAGALAVTLSACGASKEEGEGGDAAIKSFPTSDPGTKSFGEGDLGIANYALTLEYLEAEFYARAADSGLLKGQPLEVAKRFGEQEREHVEALQTLIRGVSGKPAEEPESKFPLESEEQILKLAATVEDLGANAYLGQAAFIKDPEILAAALSIHSVEARHAAVLAEVTGAKPSPRAYAEPADATTVLAAVKPFLAT